MATVFDDRLGQAGYTMVARAPKTGLPGLSDGAWRVVGGENPIKPGEIHDMDRGLIPFLLAEGGDVVLYRLSHDLYGEALPVLTNGGMGARPPSLTKALPYDRGLMAALGRLRDERAATAPAPAPKAVARERRGDRSLGLTGAAFLAALACAIPCAVWALRDDGAGRDRWNPDMSNPRDAAIARGATQLVIPRQSDPTMLDVVRVYPSADGVQRRDVVDSFRKADYERSRGYVPNSPVPWRNEATR
jgi:hypothetical protein